MRLKDFLLQEINSRNLKPYRLAKLTGLPPWRLEKLMSKNYKGNRLTVNTTVKILNAFNIDLNMINKCEF